MRLCQYWAPFAYIYTEILLWLLCEIVYGIEHLPWNVSILDAAVPILGRIRIYLKGIPTFTVMQIIIQLHYVEYK